MDPSSSNERALAGPALDLRVLVVRLAVLSGAWIAISGDGSRYWAVGAPAIVIAALVFAAFVLATVAASLVRVARGPTRADRMMAAQLFGTALTSVLLVLSWGLGSPELVDVALVFAALAAITMVAFVRRAWW